MSNQGLFLSRPINCLAKNVESESLMVAFSCGGGERKIPVKLLNARSMKTALGKKGT